MEVENTVTKEGWLRKRGARVNMWNERYFVLRGPSLFYFLKSTDIEPKGMFLLQPDCKVSEIRSNVNKKRKQFVFRVTWPAEDDSDEKEDLSLPLEQRRNIAQKKKEAKASAITSTVSPGRVAAIVVGGVVVGALTAGVGLIAGMVVLGVEVAASGAVVASSSPGKGDKEKFLTLACDTYGDAERWTHAIEGQISELGAHLVGYGSLKDGSIMKRRNAPPPEVRLEVVEQWMRSSKWKVVDVVDGTRIFELTEKSDSSSDTVKDNIGVGIGVGASTPTSKNAYNDIDADLLRVNVPIKGSPSDVFTTLMNFPAACRTGVINSYRVVESMDNQTDIVHITMKSEYIHPTWTAPRDLVLVRYWKHSSDGSYVICLDSAEHRECPLVPGVLRGSLHGVYVVRPSKFSDGEDEHTDCLLTFIAQYDPRGWVWRLWGYQRHMLQTLMLHIVDIRDAVDAERFTQVHFDAATERTNLSAAAKSLASSVNSGNPVNTTPTLSNTPPPALSPEMWGEPDASTFRIRGKTYNQDGVKADSAPSLFKLIAVDLLETPVENMRNIAAHPKNRVFLALQRGDPTWVFVMNIMVPGPPFLSFVAYFEGNKQLIEEDTPFGRVAYPFFFGNDDEYRNNRFKLIPKVVDGNMIVKMAVKDTPTLLGNKLKQTYCRGDNYFELDVDVGSSSVARHVVGIAIGYSKAIVVDMGMCLQGNDESELPEVLFGCCTCLRLDTTTAKPL